MKTENKTFPLLTRAALSLLERKLKLRLASLEDLENIDHYMTSIDQNRIKATFEKEEIYSLEEYLYLLKDQSPDAWLKGSDLTWYLVDCINLLQQRVQAGEKIY